MYSQITSIDDGSLTIRAMESNGIVIENLITQSSTKVTMQFEITVACRLMSSTCTGCLYTPACLRFRRIDTCSRINAFYLLGRLSHINSKRMIGRIPEENPFWVENTCHRDAQSIGRTKQCFAHCVVVASSDALRFPIAISSKESCARSCNVYLQSIRFRDFRIHRVDIKADGKFV
ncbi:hypothetical protein CLF_111410 [Clonorchis sinensis]|uniref:Uncharacterized protein n=1 Tax=Clonorchis sinensis TaxID=79923 RepID=G7YUU0_CLOSI|nr:hypothetical protein CLF_111410 [Clonorchis sinensis]